MDPLTAMDNNIYQLKTLIAKNPNAPDIKQATMLLQNYENERNNYRRNYALKQQNDFRMAEMKKASEHNEWKRNVEKEQYEIAKKEQDRQRRLKLLEPWKKMGQDTQRSQFAGINAGGTVSGGGFTGANGQTTQVPQYGANSLPEPSTARKPVRKTNPKKWSGRPAVTTANVNSPSPKKGMPRLDSGDGNFVSGGSFTGSDGKTVRVRQYGANASPGVEYYRGQYAPIQKESKNKVADVPTKKPVITRDKEKPIEYDKNSYYGIIAANNAMAYVNWRIDEAKFNKAKERLRKQFNAGDKIIKEFEKNMQNQDPDSLNKSIYLDEYGNPQVIESDKPMTQEDFKNVKYDFYGLIDKKKRKYYVKPLDEYIQQYGGDKSLMQESDDPSYMAYFEGLNKEHERKIKDAYTDKGYTNFINKLNHDNDWMQITFKDKIDKVMSDLQAAEQVKDYKGIAFNMKLLKEMQMKFYQSQGGMSYGY